MSRDKFLEISENNLEPSKSMLDCYSKRNTLGEIFFDQTDRNTIQNINLHKFDLNYKIRGNFLIKSHPSSRDKILCVYPRESVPPPTKRFDEQIL